MVSGYVWLSAYSSKIISWAHEKAYIYTRKLKVTHTHRHHFLEARRHYSTMRCTHFWHPIPMHFHTKRHRALKYVKIWKFGRELWWYQTQRLIVFTGLPQAFTDTGLYLMDALMFIDRLKVQYIYQYQGLLYHRTCKPDLLCSWPSYLNKGKFLLQCPYHGYSTPSKIFPYFR